MSLRTEFDAADAERGPVINRLRECAAFTIPTVLPEQYHSGDVAFLRPYQSLGADGVKNLVNKLIVALFSPGQPWFRFKAAAKLKASVSDEDLEGFEAYLYARELMVYDQLAAMRYRAKMRTMLEQLIVIGNVLAKLTDDYKIKVFAFNQYIWKRGSDAELLWLITKETVHPKQLTKEQIARAAITQDELKDAGTSTHSQKLFDIFTKAEPDSGGRWLIRQEIKDKPIGWSLEPVFPYLAVGYTEVPGEQYSRGFVEEHIGDLRSFNGLSKAGLDLMIAAARILIGVDQSKGWSTDDVEKDTGSVITGGRVDGQEIQGIGFLQSGKASDGALITNMNASIETRLNRHFLMESAMQPQKERVTATQINSIRQELEGALGSVYTEIADELQLPFLKRVIYQMDRDNLLPPLSAELTNAIILQILTGLEALGRMREIETATAAVQILSQIPGMIERIRPEWILDTVIRGLLIDARKALKSEEEMQAEQEALLAAQAQAALNEQAIKTGGAVIEEAAKENAASAAPTAD